MPDSIPKLRVIDEKDEGPVEVVRLAVDGRAVEEVERLPGGADDPVELRLQSPARDPFAGRSMEPGVEAILDAGGVAASVEQPWGAESARWVGIPYGWFVLIVVALLGAGAWSVREMHLGEQELKVREEKVLERVDQNKVEDQRAEALVTAVESAVSGYLKARTIDEMLPWVRHPERVKPLIVEEWRRESRRPLTFARMTMFEGQEFSGKSFWVVRAEVRDGPPQTLLVEQLGPTKVKIDWETHVCHQPMPWSRFVAERPDDRAMEFRVRVTPDTYHSHEFSNVGRWVCFRLMAKDSDEYLFGYAEAGSPEADFLSGICQRTPGGVAAVILRLRVLSSCKSPRGVVIEKVTSPHWVRTDEPQEDGS
ncbi:MAG: hypothetical protein EAZ65_00570 [Verrucomicrobia bacterium]|nr:MAG: hypothetical protein EAZ84_05495 [Verrucomicrobiota bacterium]TAE89293.1 MAG: hypothetical protein EAZ82_01325 [Verrucomicrobiota bacterium]TAF27833.1 MAG: hypothetical protein EAZ71_00575 [Verrucomicrobiota bacterium]TAF42682.1 MAG: hypothetical protein EAZ65_00570 [Verrucomicrobiota bacterium]